MAGLQATLKEWTGELKTIKTSVKGDTSNKRELAKAEALNNFLSNLQTINETSDEVLLESDNYMKEEEVKVLQLIEDGQELLPEDIQWPVPLECSDFHLTKSQYFPYRLQRPGDRDSVISSLDLSVKSLESLMDSTASLCTRNSETKAESALLEMSSLKLDEPESVMHQHTKLPNPPTVTQSVLPGIIYDIAHSEGITFFVSNSGDRIRSHLFQLEQGKSDPIKISDSFHGARICLLGSEELLLSEVIQEKEGDKRKVSTSNKVRRFQLMKEGESIPTELKPYTVVEGRLLKGIALSPADLVAMCDNLHCRVTIHSRDPWTRVDTIKIDRLFDNELKSRKHHKPKKDFLQMIGIKPFHPFHDHLHPVDVTWVNTDCLCLKMFDCQTIICMSLKFKEICWIQTVPDANLLSSAYGRVYVSHGIYSEPSGFTVLRADTGEILTHEQITFSGNKWGLKVFTNPAGGVLAFSC